MIFLGNKIRRAETLVEVIIAIFVVSMGAATATSLVVNAFQANNFSKDNLIGLNLAVEGIEAARNIRDSNWLKFGSDKEHCWNMDPQEDGCSAANLIQNRSYTVDLDPVSMKWTLTDAGQGLALENPDNPTNENYHLKYLDLDGGDNERNLYISGSAQIPNPMTKGVASPYYRMVGIHYVNNDPVTAESALVTSKVQWKVNAQMHQVVLTTKLTNYQKPKS